jgi:hypothetical protein
MGYKQGSVSACSDFQGVQFLFYRIPVLGGIVRIEMYLSLGFEGEQVAEERRLLGHRSHARWSMIQGGHGGRQTARQQQNLRWLYATQNGRSVSQKSRSRRPIRPAVAHRWACLAAMLR